MKLRVPALQDVYNRYDATSQHHIEVPQNLCELYELHKTKILKDDKECYIRSEQQDKRLSNFCFNRFLLKEEDHFQEHEMEGRAQELLATILLLLAYPSYPKPNHGYFIDTHSSPGYSKAEICVIDRYNTRAPKIAKILRCKSRSDLDLAFLELSHILMALALNQDPSHIRMARVFSAGFSYFPDSKEPYVFCMLLERAPGRSIKELFNNQFINFMAHPILFSSILFYSSQFLAYFHGKFFTEKLNGSDQKKTAAAINAIEERNRFCVEKVTTLAQSIVCANQRRVLGFAPRETFKSLASRLNLPLNSKLIDKINFQLYAHILYTIGRFTKSSIALEDRATIHGDMNCGNLCYIYVPMLAPINRFTLLDFDSIKRSRGAIGDPAQDVGKFIGSIWTETAIGMQKHGLYNQDNIELYYRILCDWQNEFLSAYIDAFQATKLYHDYINHSGSEFMATFSQRVYFYKLYTYAQAFGCQGIKKKAKDILYYFLLHESGVL